MKSVVDEGTCIFFAKNNWFYIMHRFGISNYEFSKIMKEKNLFISISTGINQESYEDLEKMCDEKIIPDYITIDVANAWSEKTKKMVLWIKSHFPSTFLIVGNIATQEAAMDMVNWGEFDVNHPYSFGIDSFKIGIAGGSTCITRNKTGVFRGMIDTIWDCFSVCHGRNRPIIADGGIVHHGDIPKAIIAGATMVMAGSLFAGYDQSAGNMIEIEEDKKYKEYYGSASKYNKEELKNIEGRKILIPYRGDMSKLLKELREDLQSSISYLGCDDVNQIRDRSNDLFYLT
jgi:GMP reductase